MLTETFQAACDTSACIEVRLTEDGHVAIRTARSGDASVALTATPEEWRTFVQGVQDGRFDLPTG